MQHRKDTLPFSGFTSYVENFDDEDDVSETTNVLSFESLREAFTTLQLAETELVQTIPEIEFSPSEQTEALELPNYEIDNALADSEKDLSPPENSDPPVTVDTRLEVIVEAMLFVGNRENRLLEADHIAEKLRNVSVEEVDQAIALLNEHYKNRNCPYTIISGRSGYRMALRSKFESVRTNFYGKVRGTRLSQQAIDTLAVVAYRQPMTAEEIQCLRKCPCSSVLHQLVRRNLLEMSREVQDKKNIVRYHTTSRFLELFQIQSLDDIPRAEELDYR